MSTRNFRRPTGYNFDGEPRLVMTGGGTTIEVVGGQPVMDAGIENAVMISLFTDEGWFGNEFLEPEYRVGDCTFGDVTNGAILASTLDRAESEARRGLQWMVDEGIASEIKANVSNPTGIRVDTEIEIVRPNATSEQISLRKYGSNWMRQGTDPASARLSDDYRD